MDGTDLVITLLLGGLVALAAGVACWVIDVRMRQKQADWIGENSSGAQR
jgi:hypothetical protein